MKKLTENLLIEQESEWLASDVEARWMELNVRTTAHEWNCECADCSEVVTLGAQLTAQREVEKAELKARVDAHLAEMEKESKAYFQTTLNPSKPVTVGRFRI